MLRQGPRAGSQRKSFIARALLAEPITREIQSFKALQNILIQPIYLVYLDINRRLFMDLDVSKQFGFGVMVYHVKDLDGAATAILN